MKKAQHIALMIYMAVCPVAYVATHGQTRPMQENVWQYLTMSFIVMFCRNIWMALFFWWNYLLVGLNQYQCGQQELFNIFLGIMMFGCARNFFKHYDFTLMSKIIVGVSIACMIFIVLQILGVDPLFIPNDNAGNAQPGCDIRQPIGLMYLKAHQGIFFALAIPAIVMLNSWLAPIMLYPVWLSESTGAMLAAIAGLLFALWFKNRRLFSGLLLIVLICGGFYIAKDYKASSGMFTSRLSMWHGVTRMALGRPQGYGPGSFTRKTPHKDFQFFGDQDFKFGIGTFSHVNEETGREVYGVKEYDTNFVKLHKKSGKFLESPNRWANAHNLFVQIFFEYGYVGIILIIMLLREMYYRFKYNTKSDNLILSTSLILVFLVASVTQFPLYVAKIGYLFPITLGAFYASTDKRFP